MNDKLSLINSLKITEYEADGECLYYANVANTPEKCRCAEADRCTG